MSAGEKSDKPTSLLDRFAVERDSRAVSDQISEKNEQRRVAAAVTEVSTAELFRLQLHRRIQRLSQLVVLQAPPCVLITEILMIREAAEGAYPDDVALVLVQRMKAKAKERLGRCAHESCEKAVSTRPEALGYCEEHFKLIESEAP